MNRAGQSGGMGRSGANQNADAPLTAKYVLEAANGLLPNARDLSALTNGLLKHTAGAVARAVPGADYQMPLTAGTDYIETLAADPRVAGLARSVGSAGRDGSGNLYLKVGSGDSDWVILESWRYLTLGAAATTVSFTGLNGDLDVGYELLCNIKFNSAGCEAQLRPNSLTTNQRTVFFSTNNGGAPAAAGGNTLTIGVTRAANRTTVTRSMFFVRRGAGGRGGMSHSAEGTGAGTLYAQMFSFQWDEDTTNVIGLDIVASAANGFGAGSIFAIRPLGLAR